MSLGKEFREFALKGSVVDLAIAWWKWQLKGDEEAKKMFIGENCGLCELPTWETASKGLE